MALITTQENGLHDLIETTRQDDHKNKTLVFLVLLYHTPQVERELKSLEGVDQ